MRQKTRNALVMTGLLVGGGLLSGIAIMPAEAARVACIVDVIGKNHDGVSILCDRVEDARARGRADCVSAPDIYTVWVTSWQSARAGWCLFSARGAILEVQPL